MSWIPWKPLDSGATPVNFHFLEIQMLVCSLTNFIEAFWIGAIVGAILGVIGMIIFLKTLPSGRK